MAFDKDTCFSKPNVSGGLFKMVLNLKGHCLLPACLARDTLPGRMQLVSTNVNSSELKV